MDAQLQTTSFDADIVVQDFPLKALELVKEKVSLNSVNGFLGKVDIKVRLSLVVAFILHLISQIDDFRSNFPVLCIDGL